MRRSSGFSLVELLVALGLLAALLALALRYFTSTAELARETQARSELQDRVRMVMQVVTADLQMAGATHWVSGGSFALYILPAGSVLVGTDGGVKDTLSLYYVTSLREQSQACRRVDYSFQGDTLYRSDVNATPSSGSDCTQPSPSFQPLAEGILALDIRYLCSDGAEVDTPADCGSEAYPRSALVEAVGYSLTPMRAAGPATLTTVSGQEVTCPQGRACYALRQEVLMPNLKPLPE
ncbi:prepilin-type N-terminal cleavage/methylation domain-containing protein [Thermus thermamylovorans]|uniref:Prepilin-type N-terminal cleavage/methylation domain-containing protein n=1 Tax=Thermus thermamylovorans TaxID=2509362 RepID=A0A4Q9B1D5_9DEIN|nr:prepilin-type N-terminal cleavage/methylation domain-containing protein [Thermus thermamylovorans]TBH17404.1 prepilin-type N-terminal cleavage/methylation domain-containing protein [Thermus thermamylovorans]